ncbi:hypothetical protein [Halorarum salinum]|uniref:Uncharacterized protein n=1 Tax=Halorarum salinum TaxID=2743089 RepID=A0A7D5LBT0_9EURY|nr:hypothetical protein [Halobaculum salinum]QLG62830.1 hypothetical protein HUG12_14275 [Halobaculum salinum]
MNDDQADQVVQCLVGIGAELTAIRQELQRLNDEVPEPGPDVETFECRFCDHVPHGEGMAERHAVDGHNAPHSAWEETYE